MLLITVLKLSPCEILAAATSENIFISCAQAISLPYFLSFTFVLAKNFEESFNSLSIASISSLVAFVGIISSHLTF